VKECKVLKEDQFKKLCDFVIIFVSLLIEN
jgi:hypothetical protein